MMDLHDVLKAEIPEGKYAFAMQLIQVHANSFACHEIYTENTCYDSLCSAFESLLTLAKEPNGYFYPIADPIQFEQSGYSQAIQDVLGIVDKMKKEIEGSVNEFGEESILKRWPISTMEEICKRISALRGKE